MSMERVMLLIDADNVSVDIMEQALHLVHKQHGAVHVRRAYCTAESALKHQTAFKRMGIKPMVNLSAGKNSTDIALAVDALDLVLAERPDVVVIASSDSDFAPLVQRLREKGCTVRGIGQRGKTGDETQDVYDDFTVLAHRKALAPLRSDRTERSERPARSPRPAAPRAHGADRPPPPVPADPAQEALPEDRPGSDEAAAQAVEAPARRPSRRRTPAQAPVPAPTEAPVPASSPLVVPARVDAPAAELAPAAGREDVAAAGATGADPVPASRPRARPRRVKADADGSAAKAPVAAPVPSSAAVDAADPVATPGAEAQPPLVAPTAPAAPARARKRPAAKAVPADARASVAGPVSAIVAETVDAPPAPDPAPLAPPAAPPASPRARTRARSAPAVPLAPVDSPAPAPVRVVPPPAASESVAPAEAPPRRATAAAVLACLPELAAGQLLAFNVAVQRLREARLLGRNTSSLKLFAQLADRFELVPADKPTQVRLRR